MILLKIYDTLKCGKYCIVLSDLIIYGTLEAAVSLKTNSVYVCMYIIENLRSQLYDLSF